jgi:twitching motility protein PilT
MLEEINKTRSENMITIEDPIEFIFKPQKCIISQREIGHDTWSFPNALRAAMREDPDIIFVGEIRDKETAESALSLAETGHLVFSTLHTNSAANTVNRLISFFPPEIQDSVCDRLATALIGVQSQMLVKSKMGSRV